MLSHNNAVISLFFKCTQNACAFFVSVFVLFSATTLQVVATGVMKRNGSSAVLCRPLELHVLFLRGIPGDSYMPKET